MALKDTFKNFFDYFGGDPDALEEEAATYTMPNETGPTLRVAPAPASPPPVRQQPARLEPRQSWPVSKEAPIQRLHEKQQELRTQNTEEIVKSTIDIKFPRRYEDATQMVSLLLENTSVLIDFQYMSDQQARRCLDYLDGARSVLSGSLKKVSSSMWLLTPVNVTVKVEDLQHISAASNTDQDSRFDFV